MTPERAKVLIVDDSRMIRKMLRGLLQHQGIQSIDEAPDGASALDLFEMTAYDLVLSDWNMPHVSGVELLRTIRHGKVRSHTPVLLISGDVSSRRRIEAVDAGANCFLSKPFVATELCDEVLKILSALPQSAETRPLHPVEALSAG